MLRVFLKWKCFDYVIGNQLSILVNFYFEFVHFNPFGWVFDFYVCPNKNEK